MCSIHHAEILTEKVFLLGLKWSQDMGTVELLFNQREQLTYLPHSPA